MRDNPINKPEDIARHTLLLHRDMPTIFDDWKQALGVPELEPAAIDNFDSGPLDVEAAAQGLGIAATLADHFNHSHDDRLEKVLNFERKLLPLLFRMPTQSASEPRGQNLSRLAGEP